MVIARKHNESEVSQLIDIVNDLWIEKKYLVVFLETFNATFLKKKTANFNVIINQEEPGEINITPFDGLVQALLNTLQMRVVVSQLLCALFWERNI